MLSVLNMMNEDITETSHDIDQELNALDDINVSKAEMRKSNKPIMEKRRRARINTCLNELKSLILDAMKKDPSRHSKLEKADILEMTVKHLQAVQRHQLAVAVAHDPNVLNKFKNGFSECAQEISRYVSRIDGVDNGVRQRLGGHLGQCMQGLASMTPLSFTAMAGVPSNMMSPQGNVHSSHPSPHPPGDVNNNQARLLQGLVAARLAAAGDTAGAALLLQGGISLLARGTPPSGPPMTGPQHRMHQPPHGPVVPPSNGPGPQPQHRPNFVPAPEPYPIPRDVPLRSSAFTAVKRSASPPPSISKSNNAPQPPPPPPPPQTTEQNCHVAPPPAIVTGAIRVIAPTARRPVAQTNNPETLIRARVDFKPVNNPPVNSEFRTAKPINEYHYNKNTNQVQYTPNSCQTTHFPNSFPQNPPQNTRKRPLEEDESTSIRASKIQKNTISPAGPSNITQHHKLEIESVPDVKENTNSNNNNEGPSSQEDKDMWRPW